MRKERLLDMSEDERKDSGDKLPGELLVFVAQILEKWLLSSFLLPVGGVHMVAAILLYFITHNISIL